jgi:hypothetical protein
LVPVLQPLPVSLRIGVERTATHEAGHAVAVVEGRFDLISVRVSVVEGSACGLPSVPWIPSGETLSSACDVKPDGGDNSRRPAAALVAMAGPAARRLKFSQADAFWRQFEREDRFGALRLLRPNTTPLH